MCSGLLPGNPAGGLFVSSALKIMLTLGEIARGFVNLKGMRCLSAL